MAGGALEEKLLNLSDAETLKSAKSLLKTAVPHIWHRADGTCAASWRLPEEREILTVFTPGPAVTARCGCGERKDAKLCVHAVAAMLSYAVRFGGNRNSPLPLPEYCKALRTSSLPELIAGSTGPAAELRIEFPDGMPHLATAWERLTLAVKIISGEREYAGTLINLRRLVDDKYLVVHLELGHFSSRDRQIIEILAALGEPQGRYISLDGAAVCELFHSLTGYTALYCGGMPLHIRAEHCRPVLLETGGKKRKYAPGLECGGALLPVPGCRIVMGRCGCWVGAESDYFFVPAVCESDLVRNFFRAGVQPPPGNIPPDFPFPVRKTGQLRPASPLPRVTLCGEFTDDGYLLRVGYLYGPRNAVRICRPEDGDFILLSNRIIPRRRSAERIFEKELLLFGFQKHGAGFALHDRDSAVLFLRAVLPELKRRADILTGAGMEILPLELRCRLLGQDPVGWRIGYELHCGARQVEWTAAAAAVKTHAASVDCGGSPAFIEERLRRFIAAAPVLMRNAEHAKRIFVLPREMAGYYNFLTRGLPDAALDGLELSSVPVPFPPEFAFSGTLRRYQRQGVDFLNRMYEYGFNAVLADEMGLGKTVQLLAFLAGKLKHGDAPALVICPASLTENWRREAVRFIPGIRVAAPGNGRTRNAVLAAASDYDIIVLSYTSVRLAAAAFGGLNFSFVVLDEAQHIKNPGSRNARICKNINSGRRIVLSGTPLENSTDDLWSIFDFLSPGMLGGLADFRRYYAEIGDSVCRQRDLAARIGGFVLRRTKVQVTPDLPPVTDRIIYCDMGSSQRKLYETIRRQGLDALKSGGAAGAEIFTTLLRLRQVCCDPGLLPDGMGNGIPSAKTELFLELLNEHIDSGHRMLLFSQFTSLLAVLRKQLDFSGIAYEYLDGATRNRQKHVDNFNAGNIPLFLLSLKAGGTGLNLASADTVVIYDPWWNPAVELQAAGRSHRIGQNRPVTDIKLVMRNSIEERIIELQRHKRHIFDAVIGGSCSGLSADELQFLLQN